MVAAALSAAVWILALAPEARAQQTEPTAPAPIHWAAIGPAGPRTVTAIGISSGWPSDPFIIVRLSLHGDKPRVSASPNALAAVTRNGGATWEPRNPLPPGRLLVLHTIRWGRVILATPDSLANDAAPSNGHIYRSIDDGESWEDLPLDWAAPAVIDVSPDVENDGGIVLTTDSGAHLSWDAGATWVKLEPPSGQMLSSVLFSPAFARDELMFAAAISEPIGGPSPICRPAPTHRAHAESAGMVRSRDRGQTWQTVSEGLSVDGAPFRQIDAFAISPTFARDSTLFAHAWGPWAGQSVAGPTPRKMLFKSVDGGEIWSPLFPLASASSVGTFGQAHIGVSREYAEDGSVFMMASGGLGSPGSSGCGIGTSTDGGISWSSNTIVQSYGGCSDLVMGYAAGPIASVKYQRSPARGTVETRPRDESDRTVASMWESAHLSIPQVHAATRGGHLMIGGYYGLELAVSESTQAARLPGTLPCILGEAGPIRAVRQLAPAARTHGCAISEPHTALVAERTVGDLSAVQIDDDPSSWTELGHDRYGDPLAVQHDAHKEPWGGPPDRTIPALIQRFETGFVALYTDANDRSRALVVGYRSWQNVLLSPIE